MVEFRNSAEDRWVGNFACGYGTLDVVLTELGDDNVIVVASGAAYIVSAHSRQLVRELGGAICFSIWFQNELGAMIITNGLWFEAFDATHTLWQSRRISWDGMRNLETLGLILKGEACLPSVAADQWVPFEINLENGEVLGGSYNGPPW